MGYILGLMKGWASLLAGMRMTFAAMFTRPVTQEYPRDTPEMSKAYRSAIKLVNFDETGTHDCIACLLCEKICPSFCITIDGHKPEGVKRKRATKFDMDFALCSLCGLCLDVCPTATLEYSSLFDLAGYKRDQWTFDLLDEFRDGEEDYLNRAREEAAVQAAEKERLKAEKAAAKAAKAAAEAEAAPEAAAEAAPEAAPKAPEAAAEAAPKAAPEAAAEVAPEAAAEAAPEASAETDKEEA